MPNAKLMFVNPPLTTSPGMPWANKHDHGDDAVTEKNKNQGSKKFSCQLRKHCGLGDLPQLGHAADLNPLHHENVAVVIEDRAMRIHKLAGDELAAVVGRARRISAVGLASPC